MNNDVQLVTLDNSIDKVLADKSDLFGEIKIGNDCFIGAHSIVLCGGKLAAMRRPPG